MLDRIEIDFDSRTWVSLKAWMEQKLSDCRTRNDATLPENETATLRGEITALKKLLALESAPLHVGPDDAGWIPSHMRGP